MAPPAAPTSATPADDKAPVESPPPPPPPPPPLSPRSLHPAPAPGAGGPFGRPAFTHVLLDLDDTLYRQERVGHTVRQNIEAYVQECLGVPPSDAAAVVQKLYREHGTTMAGLAQAGHALDPDHWHARVHAPLRYEELLARDDALVAMLRRLTATKCVFTNADRRHMDACLKLLGCTAESVGWASEGYYFENVQDLGRAKGIVPDAAHPAAGHNGKGFLAKPDPALFRLVAEHFGAASPSLCVFVDDSERNIAAARSTGMFTVLVGRGRDEVVPGADLCVETVMALPEVLPELFDGGFEEAGRVDEVSAAVVGPPIPVVAG